MRSLVKHVLLGSPNAQGQEGGHRNAGTAVTCGCVEEQVHLGSPNARRGHRNAGTAVRKRTVNTHPPLPQQAHHQATKPATCRSPSPCVYPTAGGDQPSVARATPNESSYRPQAHLLVGSCGLPVCSNVCTPLPPGYAWLLRPCPLVCHAILKGDRALPSGVGPADKGRVGPGSAGWGRVGPGGAGWGRAGLGGAGRGRGGGGGGASGAGRGRAGPGRGRAGPKVTRPSICWPLHRSSKQVTLIIGCVLCNCLWATPHVRFALLNCSPPPPPQYKAQREVVGLS